MVECAKMHVFHLACIEAWARVETSCPLDRMPFVEVLVTDQMGGPVLRRIAMHKRKQGDEFAYVGQSDDEGEGDEATQGADEEEDDGRYNCVVCNGGDNANEILLCDRCDRGTHMQCLVPALTRLPEGSWFCATCVPLVRAMTANPAPEHAAAPAPPPVPVHVLVPAPAPVQRGGGARDQFNDDVVANSVRRSQALDRLASTMLPRRPASSSSSAAAPRQERPQVIEAVAAPPQGSKSTGPRVRGGSLTSSSSASSNTTPSRRPRTAAEAAHERDRFAKLEALYIKMAQRFAAETQKQQQQPPQQQRPTTAADRIGNRIGAPGYSSASAVPRGAYSPSSPSSTPSAATPRNGVYVDTAHPLIKRFRPAASPSTQRAPSIPTLSMATIVYPSTMPPPPLQQQHQQQHNDSAHVARCARAAKEVLQPKYDQGQLTRDQFKDRARRLADQLVRECSSSIDSDSLRAHAVHLSSQLR